MQKAIDKDPKIIYASAIYDTRSALHFAAAPLRGDSLTAVKWLLAQGIPWNASDNEGKFPEDLARMCGNDETRNFLREWAVKKGVACSFSSEAVVHIIYIPQNTSCIIG